MNPKFERSEQLNFINCIKKMSPVIGLEWPRWFQEVKVPRLRENGTGWWQGCQPYAQAALTPGNAPGTHFC